jgi:predicted nucleotidyltransferase component of viral defense system
MGREPKDLAASVHRRLLNRARETGRPFNEILQYYAMERFLYRLSQSKHADRFVLKGALLLHVWRPDLARATLDIDLLGRGSSEVGSIVAAATDVCLTSVEPDGMVFDAASVHGERIAEGGNYQGVRIRLRGRLGNARVTMRLDVAFGDQVVPAPEVVKYPPLLEYPAPRLAVYSRESTIAEKLEAMTALGIANSRMKDFYDIWLLARSFDFNGPTLAQAIAETFSTRGTEAQASPTALSNDFAGNAEKQAQWRGFLRRSRVAPCPQELAEAIGALRIFLSPVLQAVSGGQSFRSVWRAPGPWIEE